MDLIVRWVGRGWEFIIVVSKFRLNIDHHPVRLRLSLCLCVRHLFHIWLSSSTLCRVVSDDFYGKIRGSIQVPLIIHLIPSTIIVLYLSSNTDQLILRVSRGLWRSLGRRWWYWWRRRWRNTPRRSIDIVFYSSKYHLPENILMFWGPGDIGTKITPRISSTPNRTSDKFRIRISGRNLVRRNKDRVVYILVDSPFDGLFLRSRCIVWDTCLRKLRPVRREIESSYLPENSFSSERISFPVVDLSSSKWKNHFSTDDLRRSIIWMWTREIRRIEDIS